MNSRLLYYERWLNRPEVLALQEKFNRVNYVEDSCDAQTPGAGEIVFVGSKVRPKWAVIACPCGCGHVLNVNLMKSVRPSWDLTFHSDGTISLLPSLWVRDARCRSHFFLYRNRIVWAQPEDDLISEE
jgi:hypothetical protein